MYLTCYLFFFLEPIGGNLNLPQYLSDSTLTHVPRLYSLLWRHSGALVAFILQAWCRRLTWNLSWAEVVRLNSSTSATSTSSSSSKSSSCSKVKIDRSLSIFYFLFCFCLNWWLHFWRERASCWWVSLFQCWLASRRRTATASSTPWASKSSSSKKVKNILEYIRAWNFMFILFSFVKSRRAAGAPGADRTVSSSCTSPTTPTE